MNCLIIDNGNRLKKILRQKVMHDYPEALFDQIDGRNGELARHISSVTPDIIFINAHISTADLVRMLKKIGSLASEVVFVTSFNPNLINLLKLSNIDYLITPILSENLRAILYRIQQRTNHVEHPLNLQTLVYNLEHNLDQDIKIVLPSAKNYIAEALYRIVRLELMHDGTRLHMASDRAITTSYRTGYLRDMLEQYGFCQIDRFHVINTRHVKQLTTSNTLILSNGDRFQVNARHHMGLSRHLHRRDK